MGNVLSTVKREQVIALGWLGWPLRRIEQATGVRRETAGAYLRSAGIRIRRPGSWGPKSLAKPATSVITDFLPAEAAEAPNAKRSESACAPYGELIAQELERGRNAMGIWQLCRARHSCQNAEFSTMPSRDHLARVFVLQTPIVTGILRGLPN